MLHLKVTTYNLQEIIEQALCTGSKNRRQSIHLEALGFLREPQEIDRELQGLFDVCQVEQAWKIMGAF